MSLLEKIEGPEDVRHLQADQLQDLADEVRQRLIDVVSQTGGHIGSGLGVVELTVALLRCFESPRDKIVWDVGHQGYPWKVLTGRNDRLPTLRQEGGLSGFLRSDESEHDIFAAGHAGTAMSAALGIAAARDLKDESYDVVAVVGDGAMTCGLPYEGLNNAGHSERDVILVLNDNGMSIAPNVGAMSKYLGSIIASPITNRIRDRVKGVVERTSKVVGGKRMVDLARNIEESIKNLWSPGMLFEEFGFRYFGPIDGHDIDAMVKTFEMVRKLDGPRIVHVLTEKGKGFPYKEPDQERFHARKPYDPATGVVHPAKSGKLPTWTNVFGTALMDLGREYPNLAAITAAMPSGTGTNFFQRKYPERFFDVGIAEAHATTFAAGLAIEGIRPVVAIYSSFLQRAYDSVFHDVALQNLPVVFCMDRAGMVGADGQTHMGLYDIAYMLTVPGLTVTQPKNGAELIGLLKCALEREEGPFSIRYPRDSVPDAVPEFDEVEPVEYGTWEVLREGDDCAILAVGAMCQPAMEAVDLLKEEGVDPTIVNCRFIKPLDEDLLAKLAGSHRFLVTVEEGTDVNGFGSFVASRVETFAPEVRVAVMGIPDEMYQHATRARQLEEVSLTPEGIAARVRVCIKDESLTTA